MPNTPSPGPLRHSDLSAERISYLAAHLLEENAPHEPFALFDDWLADAISVRDAGARLEPTAMSLATLSQTPDGSWRPHNRFVLLKSFDADGFVFFTNYDSDKARELEQAPWAALALHWAPLFRSVRIEGSVTKVSRQMSEAYFAERPRDHQLAAWASNQSRPADSLDDLDARYDAEAARFGDEEVPCPPHWGGYRVAPDRIEFWQGQRSRMHDRLVYTRAGAGWELGRLAP